MTEQTLDELEDLAAELDDDDNDPQGDDEGAEPLTALHWYAGYAQGGPEPYDRKLLVSRFPSGILLVDKAALRAWVYDFDGAGGLYRCRDDAGSVLDHAGRWRAAEGPTYEVRAYDPDFTGDDVPAAGDTGGDYDEAAP